MVGVTLPPVGQIRDKFCEIVNALAPEIAEKFRQRAIAEGRAALKKCRVTLNALPNDYNYKTRKWQKTFPKDSRQHQRDLDPNMGCPMDGKVEQKIVDALAFVSDVIVRVLSETREYSGCVLPVNGPCEIRIVIHVSGDYASGNVPCLAIKDMYYVEPLI